MDFVTTLAQLGRCTLQRIGRTPGLHRPAPYNWVTDAETGRPFRIPQEHAPSEARAAEAGNE